MIKKAMIKELIKAFEISNGKFKAKLKKLRNSPRNNEYPRTPTTLLIIVIFASNILGEYSIPKQITASVYRPNPVRILRNS